MDKASFIQGQTSKKDAQLLTVPNETQEQENSAGMAERMLPAANDPNNQTLDYLKSLGITPSQSVPSIESLMQELEVIAKTLLINSIGVEPPREMIEQMKMKLASALLQPSQLQQQNPMPSTSLLNTPSTSILRKDPPQGASFGGSNVTPQPSDSDKEEEDENEEESEVIGAVHPQLAKHNDEQEQRGK